MPTCGSQVVLCDVPIRFDTYSGCGHACAYCFAKRRGDIQKIKPGESLDSLLAFIKGKRSKVTEWCDWNIPLHWGGMSDPFQPVEKVERRSLAALKVFAETGYPFIVSTKNAMVSEEPYFPLIKECDCVVQFSACSPRFDAIERGASPFKERVRAAGEIAKYKRVNIRVQPYIPAIFKDVLDAIRIYSDIGVHGIIIEGMKYQQNKVPGLIPHKSDFVYPVQTLLPQFLAIKDAAHKAGLKFYCGENRLRSISDELCCCGIEGMGWQAHEANMNHYLFDPNGVRYTDREKQPATGRIFGDLYQTTILHHKYHDMSFADAMNDALRNPFPYTTNKQGAVFGAIRQTK